MNLLNSSWFYWAIGIAVGLPVALISLTELQDLLVRRNSRLARQVGLLRNYLLPLGALLLLLVQASEIPARDIPVRVLTTVFGLLVLVLLLSGLNATVFEAAPEKSWRKRLPGIFLDVARFALIGVGLARSLWMNQVWQLTLLWGAMVGVGAGRLFFLRLFLLDDVGAAEMNLAVNVVGNDVVAVFKRREGLRHAPENRAAPGRRPDGFNSSNASPRLPTATRRKIVTQGLEIVSTLTRMAVRLRPPPAASLRR